MIYIVIPVFNRWHFTQACLQSLRCQTYSKYQVYVVDHGSSDGTSEHIRRDFPEVAIIKGDDSMWWTAATNLGVQKALEVSSSDTDFILTLNNDLTVEKDYLEQIVSVSIEKRKRIVGSVAINSKNHNQVVYIGTKWNKWLAKYKNAMDFTLFNSLPNEHNWIPCDLLSGRGTLIPVQAFKNIGLYDVDNFPHYAADEDFSNRCKTAGYALGIAVKAKLYSEVDATGLKNVHAQKNKEYWKDLFTSVKSPSNLQTRWHWAKKNAPIPFLYILIDFIRLIISEVSNQKNIR